MRGYTYMLDGIRRRRREETQEDFAAVVPKLKKYRVSPAVPEIDDPMDVELDVESDVELDVESDVEPDVGPIKRVDSDPALDVVLANFVRVTLNLPLEEGGRYVKRRLEKRIRQAQIESKPQLDEFLARQILRSPFAGAAPVVVGKRVAEDERDPMDVEVDSDPDLDVVLANFVRITLNLPLEEGGRYVKRRLEKRIRQAQIESKPQLDEFLARQTLRSPFAGAAPVVVGKRVAEDDSERPPLKSSRRI